MPHNCLSSQLTDIVGSAIGVKYVFPDEPLIENRYGKMLSGIFRCEIYRKDFEGCTKNEPDKEFGEIVLLPLIKELDHKNAVSVFLEDLLNRPQTLLPPDWVSKVKIPSIEEIKPKINIKINKINKIKNEISILEIKK